MLMCFIQVRVLSYYEAGFYQVVLNRPNFNKTHYSMALLQAVTCKSVRTDRRRVARLRWSQRSKFVVAASWSELSLIALYSPNRSSSLALPSSTVRHSLQQQQQCRRQAYRPVVRKSGNKTVIQLILSMRNNEPTKIRLFR